MTTPCSRRTRHMNVVGLLLATHSFPSKSSIFSFTKRAKQVQKNTATHSRRQGFYWLAGMFGLLLALFPLISAQTVAAKPHITEFPAPGRDFMGQVQGITAGSDGALWFVNDSNVIGRITTQGVVSTITLPQFQFNAQLITSGPDKALWFTLPNSVPGDTTAEIGRLTTSGQFTAFPISFKSIPYDITSGRDGNLYFTDKLFSYIGRITPQGKVSRLSYRKEEGKFASSIRITTGPDGNLWFTNITSTGKDKIGRMTPSGQFTFFPVPGEQGNNAGAMDAITSGPDGNLWFTIDGSGGNQSVSQIGRITPGGVFTLFPVPNPSEGGFMQGIKTGSDGNLWFVFTNGQAGAGVGRITTSGKITMFFSPTQGVFPFDIAPGPDGNLWFTEIDGVDNLIANITTH